MGRVRRCFPGHALPFEAFPLVSSCPAVTGGRCLLAVSGRCGWWVGGLRTPCLPRWRLSASRPCSAAEVRGARWLLPAALARCSPGLVPGKGGRSASAWLHRPGRRSVRDRSRSPGRTRVHPVFRPNSDLGRGATGPRLIRRIARGSALPQRARRHAPKEPGGRFSAAVLRRSTSLVPGRLSKQSARTERPRTAFSCPVSDRYALFLRFAPTALTTEVGRGWHQPQRRCDNLSAPSTPGSLPVRAVKSELLAHGGRAARTCFPCPGVCYVKELLGSPEETPVFPGGTPSGGP